MNILFVILCLFCSGTVYAGALDVAPPSHEEELTAEYKDIRQFIKVSQERHEANQKTAFDRIWNNSKFSPQELIAKWGSDAADLFIKSVINESCIKQINPEWQMMSAPYKIQLKEDGTVDVGECISQSCMPKTEDVPVNPEINE